MAIRVGFLGAGLIAHHHARSLASAGDRVRIMECFDPDRDRAERFAATYGGAVATLVDEVIDTADAVFVCAWTAAHPPLVKAVVDAGRAVFCEKPLAVNLAEATAMTEHVQRAGVINQVGLVLRRSPAFRWVAGTLARSAADVGPVMSIVFRDDQYIPNQGMYDSTWRVEASKAGAGTLLEHSIHDLDLIRWLLGPVHSVSGRTANFHGHDGIEDLAHVQLYGPSGATAGLMSIWHDLLGRPSQRRVEVFCQRAYFHIESEWHGPVSYDIDGRTGSLAGSTLTAAAAELDGETDNPSVAFVDAVTDGHPAHPDFSVALEAHRLCDAAYRSAAADGQPISVH